MLNCIHLVLLQFHENWSKLMEWLDESEKTLDSEVEIANEPDKLKKQLSQHKVSGDAASEHPYSELLKVQLESASI